MCPIQRACPEHLLTFVRTHPVFDFMRDGIANGKILPCVRKNEIHFYEGGARLFRFTSQSIYTDNRYIDGKDGGERRLSVTEQSSSIGPRNTWLPDRLREADDWTVDDERPVVIDGRGDKVVAVREFVDKFAG